MPENNRCILLWRVGNGVVAAVYETAPQAEIREVLFEGARCRELEFVGFFNHLIGLKSGDLVGFSVQLLAEGSLRAPVADLLEATNVTGDADWMDILLCDEQPFEDDAAQGFFVKVWTSRSGRTILSLPEYDDSLRIGFELASDEAPIPSFSRWNDSESAGGSAK